MRISVYLSEEEVTMLESKKQEGETLPQSLKRIALSNVNPTSAKEHVACLVQATKWVMAKYKEGKIGE